jgi:hypothetical protein
MLGLDVAWHSTYLKVMLKTVPCTVGLMLALATPAAAQTNTPIVVPQLSVGDTVNLRNRQERENFRLQQQINRDVQGLEMRQRQPRIEVPVMKPRCRPGAFGIGC